MEKVPWAKKVQSRSCEEFQAWLVRGDYQEGDHCDWAEAARKEKLLDKLRRRDEQEELEKVDTSRQVLGRAQTGAADTRGLGVTTSESTCESEEEEGEEGGWMSPERGEREEEGGQESDSSDQSLVTHIRTPPRITVQEEEEEEEEEETTRTTEIVEGRLVIKIPTPTPSLSPGEVPLIGRNLLRLSGKRLKLS